MTVMHLGRREFLKASATGSVGLVLGFYLPASQGQSRKTTQPVAASTFAPNAFVRIGADDTVTIIAKHLEMGQGTYTGLATLVVEELDADWDKVKVEGAPADTPLYKNLAWGAQGTGGSSAIANSYEQMRRAGATARTMLVAAAAEEWQVPATEITVERGVIMHGARKASFGQVAQRADTLTVPTDVKLKDPKDFRYIGKHTLPRKDSKAKCDGSARYTIDVKLPGMLTAVVAHPPRFGGKVKAFDATKAKAVKGVVDVVQIPEGVAVLATHFWAAKLGRDALEVQWDESAANKLGSDEILAQYKALAEKPGLVAHKAGDAAAGFAAAPKTLSAAFEFPYLAHATMEPMNCVVKLGRDSCEVWNGEQSQTADQGNIAAAVGMKPEQVKINMLYAGGSFGRRANPHSDYVIEAAHIAKAIKGRAPIKLQWTREDDMRAGHYRPAYYHGLRGGLDASGNPTVWQHRIVGQSIVTGTPFESVLLKEGVDSTSVEGASNLPYAIPNILVELNSPTLGVPVQWWRSVGSSHTAFSTEIFVDELAAAAGKDPVEFRRALLAKHPRHLGVLNLAAEKAGWETPLSKGRARGVAVHESFKTFVAQVAEVSMKPDGTFRVDRVVCAVDCGVAVNPDVIRAQMEGGIGFALAAALDGAITLKDGRVEQSNFHDYQVLRMHEMPIVEVHIVPSQEAPTGVGEPGVPPLAPAVSNALFGLTGNRIRTLPIRPQRKA